MLFSPDFVICVHSYWVFTYGVDRLVAGIYTSYATDAIAIASYLIEAATYYNEACQGSVKLDKARFVYIASFALAVVTSVRLALIDTSSMYIFYKDWSSIARPVVFAATACFWIVSIVQALCIVTKEVTMADGVCLADVDAATTTTPAVSSTTESVKVNPDSVVGSVGDVRHRK
jgi:hypothetical protein